MFIQRRKLLLIHLHWDNYLHAFSWKQQLGIYNNWVNSGAHASDAGTFAALDQCPSWACCEGIIQQRVQLHEWQAHTIPILYPNSHFEVSQGGFRDFSRMADRQCDDAEVPGMSQVPLGDLARLLEANSGVRTRVMDARNGQLTRWPSPTTVGIKSVKAMSLNANILEIMAEWWVGWVSTPKPPAVDLMRREAVLVKFDKDKLGDMILYFLSPLN